MPRPSPRSPRLCSALSALIWLAAVTGASANPPCPLDGARDRALQTRLEQVLQRLNLLEPVRQQRLSVAIAILDDPLRPRLAELNGARMYYAASVPKIAILFGAAVELEGGRLGMDETLQADLHAMIRNSCNACATRVLERVGRERLIDILQDPEYRFYDRTNHGGLWVGKPYAAEPVYRRDPVGGKSHGANAFQLIRFYCALNEGSLVSPRQTKMMLDALKDPALHHKFVRALDRFETDAVYRKSGTWKSYHADSAMVRVNGRTYAMAALAHDAAGSRWLERLGAGLHVMATSWQKPAQEVAGTRRKDTLGD